MHEFEYEYRSCEPKLREKMLALWLLCLAVLLWMGSFLEAVSLPLLLQLPAAVSLLLATLLTSACLLRDYSCRIRSDERGETLFEIIEHSRRGGRVVCRFASCDLLKILPDTKQSRRALREKHLSFRFYNYTARLFAKERRFLLFDTGEDRVCLAIPADPHLLEMLSAWL